MGNVKDATLLHHVCIILLLLWFLNSFDCCHPVAYFLSLVYLYFVHEEYVIRLRKRLKFEAKIESNQRMVFSDSETVKWLNHAIEKIWPVCLEEIVSQKILLPMVPWFLHKYKPWTVKDAEIQHLHLGRSPPVFTEMRVLQQSNGDDDLVLELGVNFVSADDMSAILGVKLRKLLGFGMWAKSHLLDMKIEGKVLVGFKFLPCWPFIGRLHVCFAGPPYSQITVKPIFTHGINVSEFPGIAGWIDNLMALVFEQTLVEPNMLVVDVKKFCSPQPENWFFVDAKEPIAHATVEILEAADMKPADLNADPFVKGRLGPYRFRTKTQKKTLAPKWHEEFKIPICTWESPNILVIEVVDKDFFSNDTMGDCCLSINEIRDGRRHEMWLPLKNIKWGRLHLAVTVSECNKKPAEYSHDLQLFEDELNFAKKRSLLRSSNILPKVDDDQCEAMDNKRKPRNRFRIRGHDEQALGDGHNSTRKLVEARALIHPTNIWKLIKSHRRCRH
ncbi:C2 domain-containing protein At1g53590-like isoform X2 [Henckelia pumila]|uniref:C2 domain-containing protein At1g53590-like isoform X2 n=1 Tax=Henckelia pumila TaxID=405737 RepID=UPI003C6DD81B